MALEIALALALPTPGAGLMVKSYRQLSRLDPGYRQSGLLTAALELPAARYNPAQIGQFADQLLPRLRALPGVRSAAFATDTPLDNNDSSSTYSAEADSPDPAKNVFRGFYHYVTPEFLRDARHPVPGTGATFGTDIKADGEKLRRGQRDPRSAATGPAATPSAAASASARRARGRGCASSASSARNQIPQPARQPDA